jgi:hypothetical protein
LTLGKTTIYSEGEGGTRQNRIVRAGAWGIILSEVRHFYFPLFSLDFALLYVILFYLFIFMFCYSLYLINHEAFYLGVCYLNFHNIIFEKILYFVVFPCVSLIYHLRVNVQVTPMIAITFLIVIFA